jgi:hypothetical protein
MRAAIQILCAKLFALITDKVHMKPKWRWLVLVLVVVAGLVVEVLCDPLQWAINSTRIAWYRIELPLARVRWETDGITE